ncbi:MAG: hypothetical protein WD894_19655 [Pirellulales bacterium]
MNERTVSKAKLQATFALTAVISIGVVALGWSAGWYPVAQFFRSYLVAWLFWLSISLGSLLLLLLHNLTGGAWGWVSRHILLASASTLPFVGLLFLPIAFGLLHIYEWADEAHMAGDPILAHKQPYLNPGSFFLRAGIYWLIWLALLFFVRWTSRRIYGYEIDAARRMRVTSGLGLGLSALAITFASFDLGMSLEPKWYSTIYGVIFFVGQGLAALAFTIVALAYWPAEENAVVVAGPDDLHDLGKLLLAFTMFWAYVSFSQFLIIWYGNIPEEVEWYEHRFVHGWQWVAVAIAVFHFILPFLVLLGRGIKRMTRPLATVALWMVAMRWLDTVWQIEPAFARDYMFVPWLDLAITAAIGGVWLLYFTWLIAPVAVPVGSPPPQ